MRTDLTLRARDGSEQDVAVLAPEGTTFADVAELLARAAPSTRPAWSRRHRLRPDALIGRGALASGAMLTTAQTADDVEAPGVRLEVVGGPGAGHGVTVTRRVLVVGRGPSCDLALPDVQVSRRHAVLTIAGSGVTVRDLDSTHGTWVDGVPVVGEQPIPAGSVLRVGDTFLAVSTAAEPAASVHAGPGGTVLINRPPRALTRPDEGVIELPAEPGSQPSPPMRWIAALLPAAGGVVLATVLHSVQFLALAALTPLALLAGTFGDRLHWRRSRRRAVSDYRRDVVRTDAEVAAAIAEEMTLRRAADPPPAVVGRIARTPTIRLWERRGRDDDLLRVRIGLGELPSAVRVDSGGAITPATTLAAVPCTVDLGRGPIGIVAPPPVRDALARWVVVQLAVLTSPGDVEISLLLSDGASWRWARWLPHLRGRVASTPFERDALVDDLADLVRARRDGAGGRGWTGPRMVLVLDHVAGSPPRLAVLLADGITVGLTAVCLAGRLNGLPDGCTEVVRAIGDVGSAVAVGTITVVADQVDVGWADGVARALAPLSDAQADSSAALPSVCRFAELSGGDQPSAADIAVNWRRSDGSPSAVLGVSADGPLTVDLQRDGPHVLVAGTTGAGKSELLQTLVIALAAAHPPSELNFLLIDYKGGAAFAECAELPHAVGLVTDLDDHLTTRVLASLDSEIRRREALLAAANASDLAAYRARGVRLPRLVLVVDEFAALAEELTGFVPGLVGIAQRGRSLGLHLVLATQRPSGVVSPEIRANTALRIALRVTSAAESIDVIDGPEAAGIHRRTPGRGYLRVGTTTTAFQAARVAVAAPAETADRIRVVALDGWRRLVDTTTSSGATDLQRLVDAARSAAADEPAARRPWLPPLPARLTLADLPTGAGRPMQVPIGLLDLPAAQRQEPLAIDLAQGGSVLLVGGARSGRTTALLTLAIAAATRCSPADLDIHAVDSAGTGLAALRALPHLGTLADGADGIEFAARLVHRLHDELRARRGEQRRLPALLLLVDGWEGFVAACDDFDNGRTVERLLAALRDAAAGATVAITGGRATLAPRVAAQVATRLVLPLHDPADYAQAGVEARSLRALAIPGRGVRVVDGVEFQIAETGSKTADDARACATLWRGVPSAALRLRSLPSRVALAGLPTAPGRWLLGLGGDEAAPIAVDLFAGAARLLVVGPARSGRSTLLCSVLRQVTGTSVVVAAPMRSRLSTAAREAGLSVLGPADTAAELVASGLLLVDDVEAFVDTDLGAALTDWVRADVPGRAAVVAGRSDALAVAFRGLAAEIRQARCGVLLQPGPVDGELLGVSLPRTRSSATPGRGVLVPEPGWGIGDAPLPIQVALP